MLVQYGASPQLQNPKLEVSSYSQWGQIISNKIRSSSRYKQIISYKTQN
jgi:hypothetical protein